MSYGVRMRDAAGDITLELSDSTFRYMGFYNYAPSTSAEVFISIPGISPATHFASAEAPNYGFPAVESGGVRIYPGFFSAASSAIYLFRI